MGIATPSFPSTLSHSNTYSILEKSHQNSMSQDYQHQHQGIFTFSNGFERSNSNTVEHPHQHPQQQQNLSQNFRREKGFEQQPQLIGIEEEPGGIPVYETTGMLSEMFNFPQGGDGGNELLEQQNQQMATTTTFRSSTRVPAAGSSNEWYGNRQGMLDSKNHQSSTVNNNNSRDSSNSTSIFHHHHHHHQMSNINADSAAAMQLFLMNPQTTRSPSPPPPSTTNNNCSSTLHMLLPNPSTTPLQGFSTSGGVGGGGSFGQFTWGAQEGTTINNNPTEIAGVVEGQGLSLSLSTSLQHRSDDGFLYYNNNQGGGPAGASSSAAHYPYKNLMPHNTHHHQHRHHLQGSGLGQNHHQVHVGFGTSASASSLGVVNVLRNSKYVKAAQELLEEFCSIGRGQFKKNKFSRQLSNPNSNLGGTTAASSSSSKDVPPLSPADRIEHQRRKVKLLTMLDEACNLSLS